MMRLSILDQIPLLEGKNAHDALLAAKDLAVQAEKWGYIRYWVAEHHDTKALACSSPEVMLGFLGAHTSTIRIGAGAVLLPHYQPYKVAETYHMLATLFPGRIDLGLGRAPGGSPQASLALSGDFLEQVRKMPEKVEQLLHFLDDDFPEKDFYAETKATPVPDTPPRAWLLGTSGKSAELAAAHGTGYVFGQFMSKHDGKTALEKYRRNFKAGRVGEHPYTIITVHVVCAATTKEAEELAVSAAPLSFPGTADSSDQVKDLLANMITGNPEEVKKQLVNIQQYYQADELMLVTITPDYGTRAASYRFIAEVFSEK